MSRSPTPAQPTTLAIWYPTSTLRLAPSLLPNAMCLLFLSLRCAELVSQSQPCLVFGTQLFLWSGLREQETKAYRSVPSPRPHSADKARVARALANRSVVVESKCIPPPVGFLPSLVLHRCTRIPPLLRSFFLGNMKPHAQYPISTPSPDPASTSTHLTHSAIISNYITSLTALQTPLSFL